MNPRHLGREAAEQHANTRAARGIEWDESMEDPILAIPSAAWTALRLKIGTGVTHAHRAEFATGWREHLAEYFVGDAVEA